MSWGPTTFKVLKNAPAGKNPALVFGPDLLSNLKTLQDKPQHLQAIPDKVSAEKTSNATCKKSGTKFWSISTNEFSRNISKSGITQGKPIVSWIRSSKKDCDIDDDLVDRDLITVVGKQQDMDPLAAMMARAFPKFQMKKSVPEERQMKIEFISTDDNNQSDKSHLQHLIDNVREAARLVDIPCNIMHTAAFEDEARKVVADLKDPRVTIEVFQHDELEKRGMGMIHSVGNASVDGHKARMAILKFQNHGDNLKNICWVGKGIVYDTGGLSIKSKTGMPGMKADCGGAAGLLFAFKEAVQRGFKHNLTCILCLAENSVGPDATRPDDIITAYSGLTVEINNTDAEGRLVLGDGVHYATKDLKADICLDMCTLTGAQGMTTGEIHASVLTNNVDYESKAVKAGLASGDHCYPIIYAPDALMKEFKSPCADMKNSVAGRMNAQCSCAGHFIEQHLLDGIKYKGTWIHVDMAYPIDSLYDSGRASGYGVCLMQELFKEYF